MSYVPMSESNFTQSNKYADKINTLNSNRQRKEELLGTRGLSSNVIDTEYNNLNPAELRFITDYADKNRSLSDDGTFAHDPNAVFTGPTGRFYITGTNREGQSEDPNLRDLKTGYTRGGATISESYNQFPAMFDGVNVKDVKYDSLKPEYSARALEALYNGNELARSQRISPYSDDKMTNLLDKARFGRGRTEIIGRREDGTGVFGNTDLYPEVTETRGQELIKMYEDLERRVMKSVYPDFNEDIGVFTSSLNTPEQEQSTIDPEAKAKGILDVIGSKEAPLGYNQVYGKNKQIPLNTMTLDEVLRWQKDVVKQGSPSSAVGRYQFINKTLKGLKDDLGIDGDTLFTPELQDTLAENLLVRRGYNDFVSGNLSKEDFANNLAKEWASLPVVTGEGKGRSYYAGDGLNKALIGTEDILGVLGDSSTVQPELGNRIDSYMPDLGRDFSDGSSFITEDDMLRMEAENASTFDRVLDVPKTIARTFTKETFVDLADWVGEGLESTTGGLVGWDLGTEEEKSKIVNNVFGINPYAAEKEHKRATELATRIVDGFRDDDKEVDYADALELFKLGITTPELFADSVGFLGSFFVPVLGWGGKAAKADKTVRGIEKAMKSGQITKEAAKKAIIDARKDVTVLNKVRGFAQKNAGLMQVSAGNVNDQIDAYKEEHGESPSVGKVAQMFATESLLLGMDRWADLSILRSPAALKGAREAFSSLPKGDKAKVLAKTLGVAGGLTVNAGKEAAQEYVQEIGQEFNVQFNFDDNGDFTSAINEAGDVLLSRDMQIAGVTGAGLGAGGAVQFAGVGALGKGVGKLGGTAVEAGQKKLQEKKTKAEKEEKVVDKPAKEGYENSVSFNLNNSVIGGDDTFVDSLSQGITNKLSEKGYVEEVKGKEREKGLDRLSDLAKVLGHTDNEEALEELIAQGSEGLGLSAEEVESAVRVSFEEAKVMASIDKEDAEAGKLFRIADNHAKAGELSKYEKVVDDLTKYALESGDKAVIGVASSILGKRIQKPSEEESSKKMTVEEAAAKAKEASEAKVDANVVLDEVEEKDYTLGSSEEALNKISELSSVEAVNSDLKGRVKASIKKIARQHNLDREAVRFAMKSASAVEDEATIGKKGYATYGKMLRRLVSEGKEEEANVVRTKLEQFLESQKKAAEALQEGIDKASTWNSKEPIVTTFKKLDGNFFDIGVNSNGKAVKSQVNQAKDLRDTKLRNVRGIQKALGIKDEPKIEAVKEEVVTEETQPVVETSVEPEVQEEELVVIQETEVQEEPKKKKEEEEAPVNRQELLVEAMDFALKTIDAGESDSDILSGIMKKLPESAAKRVLKKAKNEDVDMTPKPKEIIKDILSNSLYRKKNSFAVVKGKANLDSKEPKRGTTGVIQRNPKEYTKIVKETTLNSVRGFNEAITNITEKSKATLKKIMKPLHKYEKKLEAYGGLESADSPSRGLLYDTKENLNDNVVLAIRTALVESLNFDKDLYSKDRKTKDDVARMLGMTNSNDISLELWDLVKDRGVLLDTVGNTLGSKIVNLLGLAENSKESSDIQNFARLKADLGGAAIQMAVAEGLLEFSTVTAEEFAKARGEEAEKKGALINFVSFSNEGNSKKRLLVESDILKEGIPEMVEGRSTVHMEGVPKDVVKKNTANYHNGKVGLTPSKTHQKALRKLMDTEWGFDRELADDLLENKEAFLKFAGYVAEDSEAFHRLSYDDKQGQKGKNRKVMKDLEAMEAMVKDTEGNQSLWFEWYSTVNQRVMINSNTINPMNDKHGHRWVVQPKGMETELKVDKSDDQIVFTSKGKDVSKEVRYALSQAFGMSVDKKGTPKIEEFGNAILSLDSESVAEMKKTLLEEGKYTFTVNGKEFEAEVEHIGHVLQGIKFLEGVQKGDTVTTKLSAEFDAVTSGFGLKLMQMPIIDRLPQYLAKVGVTLPSKGAQTANSMNDLLDSEGFLDNYETLASEIKTGKKYKEILDTVSEKSDLESVKYYEILGNNHGLNSKVWGSLGQILPKAVEGEVNKELRNLFKDPFMTFNYARSINNIKRGLASNIVEGIVSDLAKVRTDDVKGDKLSMFKAINAVLGGRYKGVKGVQKLLREEDISKVRVGKTNLKQYLETFVELSYGEEVSRIFNEQFEPFISAQDQLTDAFKFTYEVFDYEYKKRLDRARKLEGKLTKEMKSEILRDLLEVFPLIDGPMSESFKNSFEVQYLKAKEGEVEGNFEDGSLSVFKESRQRGDDILPTQFSMKGNGAKVINPKMKDFAAPGVGGSVLPIHSIDAGILLSTFLDMGDMLLIHDAIIPKIDKMNDSVKQYNKHVHDINKRYSFISSVEDMVSRANNFINNSTDNKTLDKKVDWKPKGAEKGETFTLRDMQSTVVPDFKRLNNMVQNRRSMLYSDLANDPDAKVMHMAGMSEGVYSLYEESENTIKDEIQETFSDTIADMLDNLQDIINKPCN